MHTSPTVTAPIRVLVVDDSAFMRKMVGEIITRDPALCVAGQARDGADALVKLEALQPDVVTLEVVTLEVVTLEVVTLEVVTLDVVTLDVVTLDVVTLDVEMPVLDGYGTLAQIMPRRPTPVLMLSSLTQAGADATLRCLELGAVDVVGKPSGSISLDINKIAVELTAKVKLAANVKLATGAKTAARANNQSAALPPRAARLPASRERLADREKIAVLAIGSSTGGPRALQELIPALPADLGLPIVIVQHMPAGFTASLAHRLEQLSPFTAKEAEEGDRLHPGRILVAPGGFHLQFDAAGTAHLTAEPPIHGVRPAVDITFASLAHLYGLRLLAVLLTGMGRDGARSMKLVQDRGGLTLAEDETTCVVYGMPKAAAELGGVGTLLPLPALAPAIARACLAKPRKETL